MKISILGASGFIGQNLIKNLNTVYKVSEISLRRENWEKSLEDPDVFINLVGKAHDHKRVAKDEDYTFANVTLVKQIFEIFNKSDAKLFIHFSSIAALEEFESIKALTEDDDASPFSIYGKTKREAEEWLLSQKLLEGKKMIIIRPPMVHGIGDKGNLGILYKLISKGIPYPLSSFDNERSFISIDNFSFFVKEIINKSDNLKTGIYHIADDEPISTMQIIEIIKKVKKKNVLNLFVPKVLIRMLAKLGDVVPFPLNSKRLKKMTSNLTVSNHKIKSALGIDKLPLTAEQGLEKTIKSF